MPVYYRETINIQDKSIMSGIYEKHVSLYFEWAFNKFHQNADYNQVFLKVEVPHLSACFMKTADMMIILEDD
jgi:hypothetical protein